MRSINVRKRGESQMSYANYLDYWMKEYFEINFKYSTAKRYKESFEVIKKELGRYRNGAEIKDIANILGHSSIETTENYYILSSKENQKEANSTLDMVISTANGRII